MKAEAFAVASLAAVPAPREEPINLIGVSPKHREPAERLLKHLELAREPWVKHSEISKVLGRSRAQAVIAALVRAGILLKLGRLGRAYVFALAKGPNPEARKLEITKLALLDLRAEGALQAMPLSERSLKYKRHLPSGLRKMLKSAVYELKKDKRVVVVRISRKNYFFYVDALRDVASEAEPA